MPVLTLIGMPPSVRRVPRDPLPDWVLSYRRQLGDRIRDARLHRNRTQEAVYLATGIPRTTYQGIERGTSDPKISDLLLIAAAIDVPLGDLVDVVPGLPR